MATRWNNSLAMLALLVIAGCTQQPLTPREAAEAKFESGQWRSAVEGCTQLLADKPNDAELISMRGRALSALTQYEEALVDLTRWSELAPNDPEPLYHRAIVYDKLDEAELADADYKLAKSIDPLHKRAYEYEISSAPPPRAATTRRSESDPNPDSSVAENLDQPEEDAGTGSYATSSSRRRAAGDAAAENSAREEAIWDRINERIEQTATATPDSDVRGQLGPGTNDEPSQAEPQGALDRVADQLFIPEETPTVTPVVPEYTPPNPQISTALPTDPYGNVYAPGRQPLGTNPNAGFTTPPPGYQNNYSGQPGFTPYNDFSNPVTTALPPQLQGKLGTNAGVTQYGGSLYPPTAGTGTASPYTVYGPSVQLPNNNPLAPTPTLNRRQPSSGIVLERPLAPRCRPSICSRFNRRVARPYHPTAPELRRDKLSIVPQRILLTSFEPFGPWSHNASSLAVSAFCERYFGSADLVVRQYPVEFAAVEQHLREDLDASIDLVILTGQSARAASIELESIAVNVQSETKDDGGPFSQLSAHAPVAYATSCLVSNWCQILREHDIPAKISHHAGTYLCNAAYFHALRRHHVEQGPPAVFIHFPLTPTQTPGPYPGGKTLPVKSSAQALQLIVGQNGIPAVST